MERERPSLWPFLSPWTQQSPWGIPFLSRIMSLYNQKCSIQVLMNVRIGCYLWWATRLHPCTHLLLKSHELETSLWYPLGPCTTSHLRLNDLATFLFMSLWLWPCRLLGLENSLPFRKHPAHQLLGDLFSVLKFYFLCPSLTILALLTLYCNDHTTYPFQPLCTPWDRGLSHPCLSP